MTEFCPGVDVRIISGKYGGRRLVEFHAPHIRPTTDRVKESLFNVIGASIEGLRVLDLFSGTGSLGIEALSRGASRVVFVDAHPRSVQILRKNLLALGNPQEAEIVQLDVFKFLSRTVDQKFDLLLVDPPFTKAIADDCLQAISQRLEILEEDAWVIIESGQKESVRDSYPGLCRLNQKDFGDKKVTFLQKQAGEV